VSRRHLAPLGAFSCPPGVADPQKKAPAACQGFERTTARGEWGDARWSAESKSCRGVVGSRRLITNYVAANSRESAAFRLAGGERQPRQDHAGAEHGPALISGIAGQRAWPTVARRQLTRRADSNNRLDLRMFQ
jgi:hypothetical protein